MVAPTKHAKRDKECNPVRNYNKFKHSIGQKNRTYRNRLAQRKQRVHQHVWPHPYVWKKKNFTRKEDDPGEIFNVEMSALNSVEELEENDPRKIEQYYEEESLDTISSGHTNSMLKSLAILKEDDLAKVNATLLNYKNCFASSINELGKPYKLLKFRIELKDDIPVCQKFNNVW